MHTELVRNNRCRRWLARPPFGNPPCGYQTSFGRRDSLGHEWAFNNANKGELGLHNDGNKECALKVNFLFRRKHFRRIECAIWTAARVCRRYHRTTERTTRETIPSDNVLCIFVIYTLKKETNVLNWTKFKNLCMSNLLHCKTIGMM